MAKKDETKHLTPTEELNQRLDRMAEAGMEKTKEWVSVWQENLRYFFSDQLHDKNRHKDWDWVIVNYLWPSAMQEIAKLTKNHPKIVCQPWEDSDADASEVWQAKLQWDWEQGLNGHGMRLEQIKAILDGKLFGYRISKVFWEDKCRWDAQKKEWEGDVKHTLIHPSFFWADPNAESIETAECVGTERWVPLEWAKNRWPKYAKQLEEEADRHKDDKMNIFGGPEIYGQKVGRTASYTSGTGDSDYGLGMYKTTRLLNLISSSDKVNGQPGEVKMVKICETYFKDYETVKRKDELEVPAEQLMAEGLITMLDGNYVSTETGQPLPPEEWPKMTVREYEEPKFPYGRYIIRCFHTILNPKEEDQVYPHYQWPFVVMPHYLLPHMWQGSDGIQMYKTTQDLINVTASHLTNYVKLYGDPKVMIEEGALSTNPRTKRHFKVGAGAGSIIRLARGALRAGSFKYQDPPAISPATMMLYQLFSQEFKNLMGLQSVGRGEKEPGEMSATQATHLAISANDRIALQAIYEDQWITRICGLIAEICQANYDDGRWVRIVGEDRIAGVRQITSRVKQARFDVNIEPASTLPFDEEKKQARYLQAYQLLNAPVANPMLPETLRVLEIIEWKKILQRHEPWLQFMAYAQLYEQVKAGEIPPEQAAQIIISKLMQVYQGEQSEGKVPIGGEGTSFNADRS
jgi:hypothetical protein